MHGTTYNQGDIVQVQFPFTDFSTSKRRPALIISPDSFNNQSLDVIVAAITSSYTRDELAGKEDIVVEISNDDLESGEIPKKSIVKISKIFTIEQNNIIKRVAQLKLAKTSEILRKLRNFF